MKFLGIKTDSPFAELYLYEGTKRVVEDIWQADRELSKGLLVHLEALLEKGDTSFADLDGLFVFRGPGSFTGLRIGITVMNTIAYAQSVPIVSGEGSAWVEESLQKLQSGKDEKAVMPFYGAEARITKPKK